MIPQCSPDCESLCTEGAACNCQPGGPAPMFSLGNDGGVTFRAELAERKMLARKYAKAQLEEAYRVRAGEIGLLATCLCCYPLTKISETESGHEPWCPSEGIAQSAKRAKEGRQHEQDRK